MPNLFDHKKLSDYIGGIVDRKIKSVAMIITSNSGYFKSLLNQALTYSESARTNATSAGASARSASGDAASTAIIWARYTSSYLGIQAQEPTASSIGNPVANGAFYIQSATKRLRVATVDSNGNVKWDDSQIAADPSSVVAAANGKFLGLVSSVAQTVYSDVDFLGRTTVPRITDWQSPSAVPAIDVDIRVKAVRDQGTNEKARATEAERVLSVAIADETGRAGRAEDNLGRNITAVNDALIALLNNYKNNFKNGSNVYGSWELRPGVLEMSGQIVAPALNEAVVTTTFPLDISSVFNNGVDYNTSITPAIDVAGMRNDLWCQLIRSSKSGTGFLVQYQSDDNNDQRLNGYEWKVKILVPDNFVLIPTA